METVQTEGKRSVSRTIEMYNLDMIIAVGYRVNSKNATRFRVWATKVLHEYLTEGYVLDRKQIAKNYDTFMKSVGDIQALLPEHIVLDPKNVLDLIKENLQDRLARHLMIISSGVSAVSMVEHYLLYVAYTHYPKVQFLLCLLYLLYLMCLLYYYLNLTVEVMLVGDHHNN